MPARNAHSIPALLYVEDSADDRLFMQALVDRCRAGFRLVGLAGHPEAVDYMLGQGRFKDRHHNPSPALVLLDFRLAGQSTAIDFLCWLRQRPAYRSLPAVIFSDTDDPDALQRCLGAGANACVPKPRNYADWEKIVAALQQCLADGVTNLDALESVTGPALIQQGSRSELRANIKERQRLLEQRRAIADYLEAIAISQKENKKQFPFPRKRFGSEASSD
jgi:two-component system, response regulator